MKKSKVLAVALSVAIVMQSITAVAANKFNVKYESENRRFVAEKISHPEKGIGEVDGIIDYENGTADRGQSYSWSAVGYGDYMYVGTCYGAITSTLKIMSQQSGIDPEVFTAFMDTIYNGKLFTGDKENNPEDLRRSVLLKINTVTGDITTIVEPMDIGGYRSAIEYKDKLYFSAADNKPYLIEIDPKTDEVQVVYEEKEAVLPSICTGIRGLTVVNDQLIASMVGNNGTYLVSSTNPSEGNDSFKVIGTQADLLDYPAYFYYDSIFGGGIWDLVSLDDKLYISVVTGKKGNKQGFALFTGEENKETGEWSYKLVAGDEKDGAAYPFGLGADRSGAGNLFVYNDYVYIGGYNDPMVALPSALKGDFEAIYKDLSAPVNLWRMDKNDNVELIIGEENEIFHTAIGNYGSGFDTNVNQYVWRMAEFDNKLYVGTFDIGGLAYPVTRVTKGEIFNMTPEEIQSQIKYIKALIELIMEKQGGKERTFAGEDEEVIYDIEEFVARAMEDETIAEVANEQELVEMLSVEDTDALLQELLEMQNNLEVLETNLDKEVIPEVETYGRVDDFLKIYKVMIEQYERIREHLPGNLIEKLDKIYNEANYDKLFYAVETVKYLNAGERGFDLFVSEDGVNFDTLTRNGFGDELNHGLRVFANTDKYLTVGTANPFNGTQLWRLNDLTKGEILDSQIVNALTTYDINTENETNKTIEFELEYNGNTLKTILVNNKTLKETQDYTVEGNKVIFTPEFLETLAAGEYEVVMKFSAGAWIRTTIKVIDSSEEGEEVKPEVKPEEEGKPEVKPEEEAKPEVKPEEPNTNKPGADKLPQTGGDFSSIGMALLAGASIFAGASFRKKRR